MKKLRKNYTAMIALVAIFAGTFMFTQCKKEKETVTVTEHDTTYVNAWDTGKFVPGTAKIDTSWTFDLVHGNVNWESKFYDFSATMLTGRFNNYGFSPKFAFDETNLTATSCNFWVQLSTFNTGQPGRDGYGKCGPGYLGVTYLDSLKTMVDPLSDTAWFKCSSVSIDTHKGYILHGTFTFNRYRTPSGYADGTPITKPLDVYLSYNGMRDFDSNNDGTYDKLRAGLTATFSFKRSDYMDNASTKAWDRYNPTDASTVNNKTYGVYSTSVGDEMDLTINVEFYKNH